MKVVGIDAAASVVQTARQRYGHLGAEFLSTDEGTPDLQVDLAYTNGVFHHIEQADRKRELEQVRRWLLPGGVFVFWENNPWNPGTRLVMKRIPFDRDTCPLSHREAEALLAAAGFHVLRTSFHFYFPSWLRSLTRLEQSLQQVPLGAQYCVTAMRLEG